MRSSSPGPTAHHKGHSPTGRRRAAAAARPAGDAASGPRAVYNRPADAAARPGEPSASADSRNLSAITPLAMLRGPDGSALFLADLRRHVLRGICIYFLRDPDAAAAAAAAAAAGEGAAARESFQEIVARITCGEITAPVRPPS